MLFQIGTDFVLNNSHGKKFNTGEGKISAQLKNIGIAAERVVLADSSHPDAEVWQTCLEAQLSTINQQSIPQLFENLGEEGFRLKEKEALQQSAMDNNAIVATGGGAPCYFDNMNWMNKNGITVFIDTPVKVLADRLINARVERPLVKGKSIPELIEFIEAKLIERRPFYEQAQVIIKGVDLNAEQLIDAIKQLD